MSYVVPAPLIYQQLQSSGGVLNSTPDLDACIIGPAYNVLNYDPGSTTSMINTSAVSATTGTASITSGSFTLTFTAQVPFSVGDTVFVPGADASGGTLSAVITAVAGLTATLDTAAGTTVSNVTVTKKGVIVNANISNSFVLPNQKPGQVVDQSSLQVYLNAAKIETLATGFTAYGTQNTLTMISAVGTGDTTAASATLANVSDPQDWVVGDPIKIAGAGAGGADLITTVSAISGSTFTLAVAAGTAVTGAVITKQPINNISSVTSTMLVEAGDAIEIDYTNVSGSAAKFNTSVLSVVNLSGVIQSITTTDMLPADMSVTKVATTTVGSGSVTVDSSTGLATNDYVTIHGAGAGGTDLITQITAISGTTLTVSPVAATAVTNATLLRQNHLVMRTRKLYNNQLLSQTNPNGGSNYDASSVATTAQVTILPGAAIVYGKLVSGEVHFAYRALRTDLSGVVQTFSSPGDITGILGTEVSDQNPLALGVQIAMANTTTQIRAIAVPSDDLLGYQAALELAEGQRLYALVPLTQETDIITVFQTHADQLSTPQMASWRVALVNTAIPSTTPIGPYSKDFVNSNNGNNTISVVNGNYVLTASNATFLSDGVVPGDIVNITSGTGTPSPIGAVQVTQVISNQQLVLAASGLATAVSYYIARNMTKTQKAQAIAATSKAFGDKRVTHVQPDTCGITIDGVVKYLPGYYLCCAIAGLIAGFPPQQGFTNIAVAGIADLKYSNFYFTRAQLGTMAENGTFLFVQDTTGGIPYVRHQLTTDVSVLEYRELSLVKNWDWLSYGYYDKTKVFIGKWNITPDTINTLRQTLISTSELFKGQSQPKIGPPLLDYKIISIAQDPNNLDTVIVNLQVKFAYPLNYMNIYLIV